MVRYKWRSEREEQDMPKQTTGRPAKDHAGRQRKLYCAECGFIAYSTREALRRCGFPSCGCGELLRLANLRDRVAGEWSAVEAELRALAPSSWNDLEATPGA